MTARFHPVFEAMGAEQAFDYAIELGTFQQRLTRCYELGAKAFVEWDWHEVRSQAARAGAAEPRLLVHGSWHGPEAPTRIGHCWVVLADDRIWEPISAIIYEPGQFYRYTKGMIDALHTREETLIHMLTTGHFGPWPER